MKDNWDRMAKLGTVSFSYPVEVVDTGDYGKYDVCKTPIVSTIEPKAGDTVVLHLMIVHPFR